MSSIVECPDCRYQILIPEECVGRDGGVFEFTCMCSIHSRDKSRLINKAWQEGYQAGVEDCRGFVSKKWLSFAEGDCEDAIGFESVSTEIDEEEYEYE